VKTVKNETTVAVNVGGAGTFDGIFLTGAIAVLIF
jgi:uncharacterized membrane protein